MVISQHKPVLICCSAEQSRPKGRPISQIAHGGAFGGTNPLDLLIEVVWVAVIQVEILPGRHGIRRDDLHRLVELLGESGHQVWMPDDHRVHRIAQALLIKRTAQRDIELHRVDVVAALRRAGVEQQPPLQGGQRQYVRDPHIAAAARRSAAG